jgi:hypothetical protein
VERDEEGDEVERDEEGVREKKGRREEVTKGMRCENSVCLLTFDVFDDNNDGRLHRDGQTAGERGSPCSSGVL